MNTEMLTLEKFEAAAEEVKKAFELGAFCVVIGSAITRPLLITKRFTSII